MMVPVFNDWASRLVDGVLLLLSLCLCCRLGMLQTTGRWTALASRRLGVVEAPGTDAGVVLETAGDGAGIETVGIEISQFKTTLALRAGDYLGVVIALRQLGMTGDVETDATCIGIEQLVLRAAIQTESNGPMVVSITNIRGRLVALVTLVVIVVIDDGTGSRLSSTPGLRITVLVLVNETGVSWVSKWLR